MTKRRLAVYLAASLAIGTFSGCGANAGQFWLDTFLGIASAPLLTPIEVIPTVSRDGATFSVKATIANRGINDAAGVPFEVTMNALPASQNYLLPENMSTVTIDGSTAIQGTASTNGNGGFYVTPPMITGLPWKEGESYYFSVVVDPSGSYFGGVNKSVNTFVIVRKVARFP